MKTLVLQKTMKMKKQAQTEKIFAKRLSNKSLAPRMYKGHLELSKTNNHKWIKRHEYTFDQRRHTNSY